MSEQKSVNLWEMSDLSTPWCIHVAATLRIADHVAAGIHQIDDLAAAAGCHPELKQPACQRPPQKVYYVRSVEFSLVTCGMLVRPI